MTVATVTKYDDNGDENVDDDEDDGLNEFDDGNDDGDEFRKTFEDPVPI